MSSFNIESPKKESSYEYKRRKTRHSRSPTTMHASRTLKRFVSKHIPDVRRRILKKYCPNAPYCITIGKYRHTVYSFFNHFVDFKYSVSPILAIGEKSANGFVREIKYERDGIIAYTILKSNIPSALRVDSLIYEYMVGLFINQQSSVFPCFIETYGLFFYRDDIDLLEMQRSPTTIQNLKSKLILQSDYSDFSKFCRDYKNAAIMIQHLKPVQSLGNWLNSKSFSNLLVYELANVFYQIYMPLGSIADRFTHYDLHLKNILLYTPSELDETKYIQYHYETPNGVVSFRSRFIVKIIDYGQCHYQYSSEEMRKGGFFMQPQDIYHAVCSERECTPMPDTSGMCGEIAGFGWLNPEFNSKALFKSALHPNQSADLRAINGFKGIRHTLGQVSGNEEKRVATGILDLVDNVVFGVGVKKNLASYASKPVLDSGLYAGKINNVMDAAIALGEFIMRPEVQQLNLSKYSVSANCLGTITVNPGKELKFV